MADELTPGDVAWVKIRGYPRWPAKICSPSEGGDAVAAQRKAGTVLVNTFGDHMYSWVASKDMSPFDAASANQASGKASSARIKQAIAEALAGSAASSSANGGGEHSNKRPRLSEGAEAGGNNTPPSGATPTEADLLPAAGAVAGSERHIEHLLLLRQSAQKMVESIDLMLEHYRALQSHGLTGADRGAMQ